MNRLLSIVLFTGVICGLVFLMVRWKDFYWPGNQQGYEPVQPIAFSHRLHAGKLQISCLYCHFGSGKQPACGHSRPPACA